MAPAESRVGRTEVLVALGTAVVALGLLLGLPPLDAADPETLAAPVVAPAVGSLPWSLLALGLLVQSAALLAVRRFPGRCSSRSPRSRCRSPWPSRRSSTCSG